jgi:hypothetical protein
VPISPGLDYPKVTSDFFDEMRKNEWWRQTRNGKVQMTFSDADWSRGAVNVAVKPGERQQRSGCEPAFLAASPRAVVARKGVLDR